MFWRDQFGAEPCCRSERHCYRFAGEFRNDAFTERAQFRFINRIAPSVEGRFERIGSVQARDQFSRILIARLDDG